MSKVRDWGARSANYEHGLAMGNPIYCGQNLKDFIGLKISGVDTDEIDSDPIVYLEGDDGERIALYLDGSVLDGERMKWCDLTNEISVDLFPLKEAGLAVFRNLELYTTIDVVGENDEVVGKHFIYCNSKELEGKEEFITKDLYVFYDGRIMTGE